MLFPCHCPAQTQPGAEQPEINYPKMVWHPRQTQNTKNCLEEPKAVPKENQDKKRVETPKISPTRGLGKHRNDLEKPKASQKEGFFSEPQSQPRNELEKFQNSPKMMVWRAQEPAQKWFERARKPARNGLGKLQNQPRHGLENQSTKLALDKLKPKNFPSKLRSKFSVKTQRPKPCTIPINLNALLQTPGTLRPNLSVRNRV